MRWLSIFLEKSIVLLHSVPIPTRKKEKEHSMNTPSKRSLMTLHASAVLPLKDVTTNSNLYLPSIREHHRYELQEETMLLLRECFSKSVGMGIHWEDLLPLLLCIGLFAEKRSTVNRYMLNHFQSQAFCFKFDWKYSKMHKESYIDPGNHRGHILYARANPFIRVLPGKLLLCTVEALLSCKYEMQAILLVEFHTIPRYFLEILLSIQMH